MQPRPFLPRKCSEHCCFAFLLIGMAIGTVALSIVMAHGHRHDFNAGVEPAWGMLIISYEYFVFLSSALALLAGLGSLRTTLLTPALLRTASLLAILAFFTGLGLLAIEISQPLRLGFLPVETSPTALTASLAWGCFGLNAALLVSLFFSLRRPEPRRNAVLALTAWLSSMFAMSLMDHDMARLATPPHWHDPAFFGQALIGSLLVASSLIPLIVHFSAWLKSKPLSPDQTRLLRDASRPQLLLLLIMGCFVAGEMLLARPVVLPDGHSPSSILLGGPLAASFWILEITLGLILPAILLLRQPAHYVWGALAVLAGQFFNHFNRIVAVQAAAILDRSPVLTSEDLILSPCLPKTLVAIGALSFFLFLWAGFEKWTAAGPAA